MLVGLRCAGLLVLLAWLHQQALCEDVQKPVKKSDKAMDEEDEINAQDKAEKPHAKKKRMDATKKRAKVKKAKGRKARKGKGHVAAAKKVAEMQLRAQPNAMNFASKEGIELADLATGADGDAADDRETSVGSNERIKLEVQPEAADRSASTEESEHTAMEQQGGQLQQTEEATHKSEARAEMEQGLREFSSGLGTAAAQRDSAAMSVDEAQEAKWRKIKHQYRPSPQMPLVFGFDTPAADRAIINRRVKELDIENPEEAAEVENGHTQSGDEPTAAEPHGELEPLPNAPLSYLELGASLVEALNDSAAAPARATEARLAETKAGSYTLLRREKDVNLERPVYEA